MAGFCSPRELRGVEYNKLNRTLLGPSCRSPKGPESESAKPAATGGSAFEHASIVYRHRRETIPVSRDTTGKARVSSSIADLFFAMAPPKIVPSPLPVVLFRLLGGPGRLVGYLRNPVADLVSPGSLALDLFGREGAVGGY